MDIFPRKTVRPFEPFAPKFDRASTVSLAYSNAMVLVCIVVFKKIALCATDCTRLLPTAFTLAPQLPICCQWTQPTR